MTSDGPQAAFEASTASSRWTPTAPPSPADDTAEAFEQRYADRSGVTVDFLHANGREARPCECGEEGCEGWQMIHADEIRELVERGIATPREIALLGVPT